MDDGLLYTYRSLAFPRYHFFQTRLQNVVPRWKKILDAGSLPGCISQGTVKLQEISSQAEKVTNKVKVNLFSHSVLLKQGKFDLPEQSLEIGKVTVEELQWTDYIKDTSSLHPSVTVFVTQSVEKVQKQIADLSEHQLRDVIIYDDQKKTALRYTDYDNSELDSKTADCRKSLVEQIQYLLEEKVISVIEMIAEYNKVLVPKQEEEVDSSLLDTIHIQLINSLKNPHIVKDLSPHDEEISLERIPTDFELHRLAEIIDQKDLEKIALQLGITHLEIERIKKKAHSFNQQCYQMLLQWRKKHGNKATLKDVLETMEKLKLDISALRTSLEEGRSTDVQRDEIFHKRLVEFISKKTKCAACDILSNRYGISSSLVNEFLNAGFFDYDARVRELISTINMPNWPRDKTDNGVATCRQFSYRCAMSMNKVIHSTEDYIKAKLKILTMMKKLQFEIFGMLQQTDVEICSVIPVSAQLPIELQYELLDFPEVHGCGTCFGELLLHVRKPLCPARREEIKQLLMKYHYIHGFKSQLMEDNETTEQASGTVLEQGLELRAKKQVSGEPCFGSIGCFVHMEPKCKNVLEQNKEEAGAKVSTAFLITDKKVHCLTCAHCVRQCEDQVEVRRGDEYIPIGQKKVEWYEPEAYDVASIQIDDVLTNKCDSKLKRFDNRIVNNWDIYHDDKLIGRHVQKQGSSTGFTTGIIMCTDYVTENIREVNITKHINGESGRFSDSYNILIELPPGSEDIQSVLSNTAADRERIPTDIELDRLAEIIDQINWEKIALQLGITPLEIERIKVEADSFNQQCYQMSLQWREEQGNKATLKDLLKTMEQLKLDISSLRKRIPTDIELQRLAEIIDQIKWEKIALQLGITHLEIERIKEEAYSFNQQCYQMSLQWRKKKGNNATLKDLLEKMEQLKLDISSFRSK